MSSNEDPSTPEDDAKEIDDLRRKLANALVEEKDLLLQIDKLRKDSNTEQFHHLCSQNMSQMHQKAVTQVVDRVQINSVASSTSEFMGYINENIFDLDVLLSGVEYTVNYDCGRYFLNIVAGEVVFFIQINWHEESKTILNTRVEFASPFQKSELASVVNMLTRKNNICKITRLVIDYSELFVAREKILKGLEQKYAPNFKYFEDSAKDGYKFEIFDNLSGKHYLEANWSIKHYTVKELICHSFIFNITTEAEPLGNKQREVFTKLVEDAGSQDIPMLLGELIRGFLKWENLTDSLSPGASAS